MNGLVFDIQRFSIHDGPGVRTTVFLKGCHARCFWCQNPEGLVGKRELQFFRDRCVGCGACYPACKNGAHTIVDGVHVILRDKCECCGKCAEACPSGALMMVGNEMSPEEVVAIVAEDTVYFDYSGGGVTLSGGEPAMQPEFSFDILDGCKKKGISTAIETTCFGRRDAFEQLLAVTDLVMMDVKQMDSRKHFEGTGVETEKARENAALIASMNKPLIIRVPVIPGFNNTAEELQAIAQYAKSFPSLQYMELLPFHRLGESKYDSLDMRCATKLLPMPGRQEMLQLTEAARSVGIPVKCAGIRAKSAKTAAVAGAVE